MTYRTKTITFVQCDRAGHAADPIVKVETGPGVSCAEALRLNGWHYSKLDDKHTCPDCAKRIRTGN